MRNQAGPEPVPDCVGNLGSFALGFVTFMLTIPVRVEFMEYDCAQGATCASVTNCYTLLGGRNVFGPLGCSSWAAVGVGLLVGLAARYVGMLRAGAATALSSLCAAVRLAGPTLRLPRDS